MKAFLAILVPLALTTPMRGEARMTGLKLEQALDAAMARTHANGLAAAVIEDGRVVAVRARGKRNAAGDPLTTETVMYGASLTKAAFAVMVMQLAEEKRIDLDRSIADDLPRPLPDYGDVQGYADYGPLALDERWRAITPRMLLTHSAGFANYGFLEPDGKLRIHFVPGSRYSYSGDGIILLQFVLERGLELEIGAEMRRRVFGPAGMTRSAMKWRTDFATNLADGWDADGKPHSHDERSRVRAAGSLDTTIADMARFAAFYGNGAGLSAAGFAELTRGQLPVRSATQFPVLQADRPISDTRPLPSAGLGVVTFEGPQGHGWFKGGHDDITANLMVCVARGRRCVVLLSNDVRAETAYPRLVEWLLGETGVPLWWEYGGG